MPPPAQHARAFAGVEVALQQGNIVQARVEAVVTAANAGLRGGGGVDGAIHAAAGPELLAACRAIGGCATGSAVITPSFALGGRGIKHVIHAVGPIYAGGDSGEDEALAGAYRRSLELADERGLRSIALPSISTGVYRFPVERAARVGLGAIRDYLVARTGGSLTQVQMVLFDATTFAAFASALDELSPA